jgi:hypothetical protein
MKEISWQVYADQGVTKRYRLSWLTNNALVYMSPNAEGGGGCGVSTNEYSVWQLMSKSQLSWVRSHYPPAQWNLRGGRLSSVE